MPKNVVQVDSNKPAAQAGKAPGKPKPAPQQQAATLPIAGLLQGLLGGGGAGSTQGGLDIGSLLQGLMGGGAGGSSGAAHSGTAGAQAAVAPIVDELSAKLGIPAQTGQAIVSFALARLAGSQQAAGGQSGMPSQQGGLSSLVSLLGSQGRLVEGDVEASGLHRELAQETGLDHQTASKGLTTALNMLAAQGAATQAPQTARRRKKQ